MTAVKGPELPLPVDAFSALEERVVRTIEILRAERERRAAAETQLARTKQELETQTREISGLRNEMAALNKERDAVRQRVERLLENLDAIAAP